MIMKSKYSDSGLFGFLFKTFNSFAFSHGRLVGIEIKVLAQEVVCFFCSLKVMKWFSGKSAKNT